MPNTKPDTVVSFSTRNGTAYYNLTDIASTLGIEGPITEVALRVYREGLSIQASVEPQEADYPGINVDGYAEGTGVVYMGNFEMPCETYPTRMAARLYAGSSKYETDAPIAIVTHEVMDAEAINSRAEAHKGMATPMRKLVYVDQDLAASRTWKESGEKAMPEHQEDEP